MTVPWSKQDRKFSLFSFPLLGFRFRVFVRCAQARGIGAVRAASWRFQYQARELNGGRRS